MISRLQPATYNVTRALGTNLADVAKMRNLCKLTPMPFICVSVKVGIRYEQFGESDMLLISIRPGNYWYIYKGISLPSGYMSCAIGCDECHQRRQQQTNANERPKVIIPLEKTVNGFDCRPFYTLFTVRNYKLLGNMRKTQQEKLFRYGTFI